MLVGSPQHERHSPHTLGCGSSAVRPSQGFLAKRGTRSASTPLRGRSGEAFAGPSLLACGRWSTTPRAAHGRSPVRMACAVDAVTGDLYSAPRADHGPARPSRAPGSRTADPQRAAYPAPPATRPRPGHDPRHGAPGVGARRRAAARHARAGLGRPRRAGRHGRPSMAHPRCVGRRLRRDPTLIVPLGTPNCSWGRSSTCGRVERQSYGRAGVSQSRMPRRLNNSTRARSKKSSRSRASNSSQPASHVFTMKAPALLPPRVGRTI